MVSFLTSSITLFVFSIFVGLLSTKILETKTDNHKGISFFIKLFAGVGVGTTTFGVLFLLSNNYLSLDASRWGKWTPIERERLSKSLQSKFIIKEERNEPFQLKDLKLTKDSIETSTVIFTIAGLFLGALGIFWLGFLEATRNEKDREHDQIIQRDRILSLLELGIDLFTYIDKYELDFMDKKSLKKCENHNLACIEFKGNYYHKFTSDYRNDDKLKIKYEKHLTSLHKFLYDSKNFHKKSILEEIYKIIEQLKIIFYDKDIKLYFASNDDTKDPYIDIRKNFIILLKRFNDYQNFMTGKTDISDFTITSFEGFDKKLSTLLQNSDQQQEYNPIIYLYTKYEEIKQKQKVFYEYFLEFLSKEFCELYLVKESSLFSFFGVVSIKELFEIMNQSFLDAEKFFNSYFKECFEEYIKEKTTYTSINLVEKDLEFKEYLKIIKIALKRINSDIQSVKELYSLFCSFVILYENIRKERLYNG